LAPMNVQLEWARVHRFGADLKTSLDSLGLWAEGAYTATGNTDGTNYATRLSKVDYTLGVDFNFGPGDAGYANLQYTGTYVPGYDAGKNVFPYSDVRFWQKNLVESTGGVSEGLRQGVTFDTRWNLADDTIIPELSGSYSVPFLYDDSAKTRYGALLLKPQVDLVPADSFHIILGATLAYAWVKDAGSSSVRLDPTDNVGVYTTSNNVSLTVSYKWADQFGK